ncbi:MAG: hypothetical protein JNK05_28145 [Myxococcales bacterium]|nr:hypothetical protein [Myxococcales bacterium]
MSRLSFAVGLSLWFVASCVAPPRTQGRECLFNDECASPLICAANVCRVQCRTDRDCPTGQLCSPSDSPSKRVCALPSERAVCGSDRDCPVGSLCAGRACHWICDDVSVCARRMAGECALDSRLCSTPVDARTQRDEPHNASPTPLDGSVPQDAAADAADASSVDVSDDAPAFDASSDTTDASGSDAADGAVADSSSCVGTMSALCSGRCTDLAFDRLHCGACGAVCGGDCVSGRCVTALRVSVNNFNTCVLASDGSVYTAGSGLTLGTTASSDRPLLGRVDAVTAATDIQCSGNNVCVLRGAAPPLCWGINDRFQVSTRATTVRLPEPLDVSTPASSTPSINLGAIRSYLSAMSGACASTDVDVFCWGANNEWSRRPYMTSGATITADAFPTGVGGVSHIASVDSGLGSDVSAVCALRSNQSIVCWGNGIERYSVLTPGAAPPPLITLSGFPRMASIANTLVQAGTSQLATCGIDTTGAVWCGGYRAGGGQPLPSIGLNGASAPVGAEMIPLPVAGPARGVAVTYDAACAIQSDATVVCWGQANTMRASLGRRGVTAGLRYGPMPVEQCARDGTACAPLARITQISGSTTHFCARSMDGEVFCWGNNDLGQLGAGDTMTRAYAVRAQW